MAHTLLIGRKPHEVFGHQSRTIRLSSKLVAHKWPLGSANALICSIRATNGATSILAEVPEGGSLHLRDWLGGQT